MELDMSRRLKTAKDASERAHDDMKTQSIVEGILQDISHRGEAAVRELSKRFENWSPGDFILSESEIQECMSKVSSQDIEDIKFAQSQVRNFAKHQLGSLNDIEVETLPGVFLGHKNIPMSSVGCYVPGGKYPLVASAHMSIITAEVAGVKRAIAAAPASSLIPIFGVDVGRMYDDQTAHHHRLAVEAAALIGFDLDLAVGDVNLIDDQVGEAYGVPTEAGTKAIKLMARTEAIVADPVYSGKGLAGLIALVRSGEVDGPIVFWHTGGYHALFDPGHGSPLVEG